MIKILCVEDHYGMARLIQLILEREEQAFRVTNVTYLAEAIDILINDDFDIVLLDLNLPDSQGLDSLLQIRLKAPQIPIIVMTGLGDHDLNNEAINQGASDFLIKGDFEAKYLSEKILGILAL